jgi:hypothetical protein
MPRDELRSMTIRSTSKVAFTVLCFINVACWIGFVASEPSPERTELKQFWIPFRKAALQSDWRILEGLTNFPLIVRGELHRDPILRIRRSEFPTVFQRFLKEGVFSPNEQLEVIRSNSTIQTAASSDVTCRVGDMIFKKTDKGWRLHALYMQYSLDRCSVAGSGFERCKLAEDGGHFAASCAMGCLFLR